MTQKPNTQRYSPMRATTLAAIIFSLVFMAASIHAQTWFPVAHDLDSISIPAGTTLRYGAKAGTAWACGTQIKPLAADAWATPTKLGSVVSPPSLGVSDPANCYVKELDVAETASVQTVTVNGKPVTVPALPVVVVVPPVVTIKQQQACTGTIVHTWYSDGGYLETTPVKMACTDTTASPVKP